MPRPRVTVTVAVLPSRVLPSNHWNVSDRPPGLLAAPVTVTREVPTLSTVTVWSEPASTTGFGEKKISALARGPLL
jgi:hypothetical protein